MFARAIRKEDVLSVVNSGKIIVEYLEDLPFPSYLMLGFFLERPLHVVISIDHNDKICHIITVYEPDANLWNTDFTKRRLP